MLKVLFITNYPSPYRVDFFNLLGKEVKLTVVFTGRPDSQKHRSAVWFNADYSGFRAVFLEDKRKIGRIVVFRDVFTVLKDDFDFIILGGYSSGTQMAVIDYLKRKGIPFVIEADGGLIKKESYLRKIIKRHFIGAASAWLSSGKTTSQYFLQYGAKETGIYTYPFSSLREQDIVYSDNMEPGDFAMHKKDIRERLRISEKYMVLFVGQMIHRKGVDILLKASKELPEDVAVCIIGGDPTSEYVEMKKVLDLKHVYFLGFKAKAELAGYYQAADLFVLPTREDIWGLVVNEAMNYGLPVVSTDRCVAAMELVEDQVNGLIVPSDDPLSLAAGIQKMLASDLIYMGREAMRKVRPYTIENMVRAHMCYFMAQEEADNE